MTNQYITLACLQNQSESKHRPLLARSSKLTMDRKRALTACLVMYCKLEHKSSNLTILHAFAGARKLLLSCPRHNEKVTPDPSRTKQLHEITSHF